MAQPSDLKQSIKSHAEDLGTQAKHAASNEAAAQAAQAKHHVAGKVQAAADAADAAAGQLDPASPQAQAVQQVADRIEDVAAHLRTADIGDLANQVTDAARRHPAVFLAGAAVAGFAAARFFKARDRREAATPQHTDPWASGGVDHG